MLSQLLAAGPHSTTGFKKNNTVWININSFAPTSHSELGVWATFLVEFLIVIRIQKLQIILQTPKVKFDDMDSKIGVAILGTFLMLVCISEASTRVYHVDPELRMYNNEELSELAPYIAEEYIRRIIAMLNAYKADMMGERMVVETNALIDTKFKTLKRNADIINSILALPKGLNDAGR